MQEAMPAQISVIDWGGKENSASLLPLKRIKEWLRLQVHGGLGRVRLVGVRVVRWGGGGGVRAGMGVGTRTKSEICVSLFESSITATFLIPYDVVVSSLWS